MTGVRDYFEAQLVLVVLKRVENKLELFLWEQRPEPRLKRILANVLVGVRDAITEMEKQMATL